MKCSTLHLNHIDLIRSYTCTCRSRSTSSRLILVVLLRRVLNCRPSCHSGGQVHDDFFIRMRSRSFIYHLIWYLFNEKCTCRLRNLDATRFAPSLRNSEVIQWLQPSVQDCCHDIVDSSCVRPALLISASINFAVVQFFRSYYCIFYSHSFVAVKYYNFSFVLCFRVFTLTKLGTLVLMKYQIEEWFDFLLMKYHC